MIYLDYSANTPCDASVLEIYSKTERAFPGNPNSSHPAGLAARKKMEDATSLTARMLNADPSEIIWTSGASEANNLAVKGAARTQRHYGKHIITTPLEHPSVSGPLTWLQERGYEIDMVNIGRDGKIDPENLKELMRDDTVLVCASAVDSELGVIQPLDAVSEIVRAFPRCLLHVDATQAVGKIAFSPDGTDTASLTAHKFYGPNGVGLLYKQKDVLLEPLIHGGTGAHALRSGTPALSLVTALSAALKLSLGRLEEQYAHVKELNIFLRERLSEYPFVTINSPEDAIPHILNLSVAGIKGTAFQQALAGHDVCVSVKSACSTEGTPSRAVYAVSRDRKNALSSWRISLGPLTTRDEAEEFLKIFDLCCREFGL